MPSPSPSPSPPAADGRRTRGSRRANHAPKRFGEFTEWDDVQKGMLGTPGHGLQMGIFPEDKDSSSSGDASADPSTARLAAASSDSTVREVHERVQALMNMADAALPLEEGGGNDETDGKSLREALSESWNGQGYYAKLMAQMATPRGRVPDRKRRRTRAAPARAARRRAVLARRAMGPRARRPHPRWRCRRWRR